MTTRPSFAETRADTASLPGSAGGSLFFVANVVLRQRRWVVALILLFMSFTLFTQLRKQRSWTAVATFAPEAPRSGGSISDLAAQVGISVSGQSGIMSPQFYADLTKSKEVLRHVMAARYTMRTEDGTKTGDLATLWEIPGKSPAIREAAAYKALRESIDPQLAVRTGVVTVRVSGPTPDMAKAMADTLLAAINAFNINTRRSRAAAERAFIERRVVEAWRNLRTAQDAAQRFLTENREYDRWSVLAFQNERLRAEVARHQRLYETLTQALEQARIDEVRDTPVITILERPEAPLIPNSRGTLGRLIVSAIVAFGLGVVVAAIADRRVATETRHLDQTSEFRRLTTELLEDLSRGRLLRALIGRTSRRPAVQT